MTVARLIHRVRPETLDDLVGQLHLTGDGCPLGEALRSGVLHSFVAWGPPGTGKSVVLDLAVKAASGPTADLRGGWSGVDDVRRALEAGAAALRIESLHRCAPDLQDALLAALDRGCLVFAASGGAPNSGLAAPLRSRLSAYRFLPLSAEALDRLVDRALAVSQRVLEPAARELVVAAARGDARRLLETLDCLFASRHADEPLGLDDVVASVLPDHVHYPVAGTGHFDVVTAFVKSLRGSDPDAGLYWLAVMLDAGEDPAFVAARICLVAAEDVGLADSFALVLARAAADCVSQAPRAEARAYLAHAAVYVATAPKSSAAVRGLERAELDVTARGPHPVPLHLRLRSLSGAPEIGYSQGAPGRQPKGQFLFPQYLPDAIVREHFYEPTDSGAEARVRERLRAWWPDRF